MASANTVVHSESHMALRVAFIGGGSGGHLLPAISIAHALLGHNADSRFLFLTSHRAIDHKVLSVSGLPDTASRSLAYVRLSSAGGVLSSAGQLWSHWKSFRQARCALKSFQPQVVVGLGALASVPGILAASRMGLPIVLLEQNCLPGKATRVLASRARLTVFGLPVPPERSCLWPTPATTCGTPVRAEIGCMANVPSTQVAERRRILILGGSQGSESINRIVSNALCAQRPNVEEWEIVHQTGEAQASAVQKKYLEHRIAARVTAFLPEMGVELASAGIVISRAGAVTIQELACAGIPAILIPLSGAAENHQALNAQLLEQIGAAVVVDERSPEASVLCASSLSRLVADSETRHRMASAARTLAAPDAATEIAGLLHDTARKNVVRPHDSVRQNAK